MNEVKTTLKRLAVYGMLLLLNIIPCASIIPDAFPMRNLSTIYLLVLSVCLVFYYSYRLTPVGALPKAMKALSFMCLLLILLRGIKYSAVSEIGVLARHTWYMYYVPILMIPLLLFYVATLISYKPNVRTKAAWIITTAVTLVLVVLVMTNDLHRQAFGFGENFVNWDSDYTHGWLFYVVNFWHYALSLAAIVILVQKCRVTSSKKSSWVILIPYLTGAVLSVLLVTDKMPKLNGSYIIEFPETLMFTAAAVLECCMQLGLIPTNTDYGKLFAHFSISAQITDKKGTTVYASHFSSPLTEEQFKAESGSRIDDHTVLNKMEVPGGFGFWLDDMTEIDRLNGELAEAKEGLAQEVELVRLRNELKEEQTKVIQRTLVYDEIARRTQRQSQLIQQLAETAKASNDPALKQDYQRRIMLFGAYIKRYANLTLLSQESELIEAGELGLSVSEVLRCLNYCGIPGESIINADCSVRADAAIAVFEAFETIIELNYPLFKGVFANLSSGSEVTLKLTFEDLSEGMPSGLESQLAQVSVDVETQTEDSDTYVCFTIPGEVSQ